MDNIPIELKETQVSLQVVVDPQTKCITMKTHTEDIPPNVDIMSTEIIPNDPLQQAKVDEIDWGKMSELDRLIFSERRRLLNLKTHKQSVKKPFTKDSAYYTDMFETDSYHELSQKEKSKLRMRKFREQETSEERDLRRFRHRIKTMKIRLMQKLRNFEDETFLKEITKRSTDRIKQKRLEVKANETPEQRAERKNKLNYKSRLLKIRRRVLRTPEEFLADRNKRMARLERFRSRHTEEQWKAIQKATNEKAKERRRINKKEWKQLENIVKGAPMQDSLKSEL